MINNIFSSAANNIFYIKINGEVYEMKFENIVMPMASIKPDEFGLEVLNNREISTIRVNIASLGSKLWHTYGCNTGLPVTRIYKTLDDCVNGVNPIFKFHRFSLTFTNAIEPIIANAEELLMDGAYWSKETNIYGHNYLLMRTYHWNGTEVISKRVFSPNTEETKSLVFDNSYENIHYDLVTKKHIVDSEYQKTCYATYEECVNDNFVKVHRF